MPLGMFGMGESRIKYTKRRLDDRAAHGQPDGAPRYQEALSYSFLLNSPKYPGLDQMEDGSLVLTLTAALTGETVVQADQPWAVESFRRALLYFVWRNSNKIQ